MILNIVNVLGALALFIFGMKTMSDGIRLASGLRLKMYLNRITKNRYTALFSGFAITGLLQSSSAFSVLLLGLVNGRLMNLKRAYALMMGANIGTTTTLWLLLIGVSWKVDALALPIIGVATLAYFLFKGKSRNWAQTGLGLGLILLGLYFLESQVPTSSSIYAYLNPSQEINAWYLLVFIGIGLLITIMLQSSSATTGLTLVVVERAGLPIELAVMLIVGANLGTTFTAHLAAWIGGRQGKLVALFHTLFNFLGAVLSLLFVPFFLADWVAFFDLETKWVLPIFHTAFNVIAALVVLGFFAPITKALNRVSGVFALGSKRIRADRYQTPEVSLLQAQADVTRFAGIVSQTIVYLGRLITEGNDDKFNELKQRIFALEEEGDQIERAVLLNLRSLYNQEIDGDISRRAHNLIDVCYHLESVGDLGIKTADVHFKRRNSKSYITPKLRGFLLDLQANLAYAATILSQNLSETQGYIQMDSAEQAEKAINLQYEQSNQALMKALEKEKISMLSILYYQELIQNYEIIGDHIYKANLALIRME